LREIKEETGLDVEIVMPFHVFDYQIKKNDEVRDTSQINFLVRMKRVSSVKISHEHQAFAWIEKEELDKYNLSVKTKETIRKAFELAYKIND
jgi:8-oxo-dGTP pyrophosphatase MutT (NUDIX family)